MFLCGVVILFTRVAEDEMGSDGHQVPDQTIQRLAASHPHRQHRHSLHRGTLQNIPQSFSISTLVIKQILLDFTNF